MTTVEGTAYAPDGAPRPGASVTVVDSNTDTVVEDVTTDSAGQFSVTVPDGGRYHVAAKYDDGSGTQYNSVSEPFITSDTTLTFTLQSYSPPARDSIDFSATATVTPVSVSGSVGATGTSSGTATRTHSLSGTLSAVGEATSTGVVSKAAGGGLSGHSEIEGTVTATSAVSVSGSLSGGGTATAPLVRELSVNVGTTVSGVYLDNQSDTDNQHVNFGTIGTKSTYTAEVWFSPDRVSGDGDHDTFGFSVFSSTDQYACWIRHREGELRVNALTSENADYHETSGAGIEPGGVYHVAVAASAGGNTATVYLDGEQVLSWDPGATAAWGDAVAGVLRDGRGIGHHGDIYAVRLWDTVRSQEEIQATADVQLNGTEPGLGHLWRLDEGTGSTTADDAGSNDGTLVDGASWTTADTPIMGPLGTGTLNATLSRIRHSSASADANAVGAASATPVRDQQAVGSLITTVETAALSTRTWETSASLESTGTTDALSVRARETGATLETTGSTDALTTRTRDTRAGLEVSSIAGALSTRTRETAGNLDSTGETITTPLRTRTSVGSLQSDAETDAVGIRSRSADATASAIGETDALGTRARTTAGHLEPTTHLDSTAGRDRLATGQIDTRATLQGHVGELTYYLLDGTLQPTTDAGAEAGRDRRTAVHVQSTGDTHARSTRARTTAGTLATTVESDATLARNRLLTGQLETRPFIQGRVGDLTISQLRGRLGATATLEPTDGAIRDRISSGALQSTGETAATVARLYGLTPADVLTASGASTALTTRTRSTSGQLDSTGVTDALSTRSRASAGDLDGTAALAGSFGRDRRILGSLETTTTLRSSAGELATYLLVGALQSNAEATADAARSRTTAAHAQTTASVASALVLTAPLAGHLDTTTVSAARSTRARISEGVLESTGTLTTDPLALVRERGATGVLDSTTLLDSTPTRHRRTTGTLTASGSIDLVITGDKLVRAITRTLPYDPTAATRQAPYDLTADTRDAPVELVYPRLLTLISDPNPADD